MMRAMPTYHGRCQCGAVRFRFTTDEITVGKRCNCSICSRRGLVVSPTYLRFDELLGQEALSLYQWGSRETNFWFCRTCGIHPFHDTVENPGLYRVNLGCVDGIDPFALPIELIDGRSY
jgi:hypothetical protein